MRLSIPILHSVSGKGKPSRHRSIGTPSSLTVVPGLCRVAIINYNSFGTVTGAEAMP